MNAPTAGMKIFGRGGLSVGFLTGAVLSLAACGGSESSEEASSTPPDGAGAATMTTAPTNAPLVTGFIMMSEQSQFPLTAATYLEESDCPARLSSLSDA